MSTPKPVDKFLGCISKLVEALFDGKVVITIEYDMSSCMASCVKLYCECIHAMQPGAFALIRPAELPNVTHDVGGNAM